jgi:hypothetical protein
MRMRQASDLAEFIGRFKPFGSVNLIRRAAARMQGNNAKLQLLSFFWR